MTTNGLIFLIAQFKLTVQSNAIQSTSLSYEYIVNEDPALKGKPIIGFPFKAGSSLTIYSYESEVDCIALDWTVNLNWAIKNINPSIVIQGNLDPASLIPENSHFLNEHVLSILDIMKDKKFIFNVGHGITPECKIDNVKKVVNIVNTYKSDY